MLPKGGGGVDPEIDALHHLLRQSDVIVLKEHNVAAISRIARKFDPRADHGLAFGIGRMCFSCYNDLNRSLLVTQESVKAANIPQKKIGPFVFRKTPREADRQDIRIKNRVRFTDLACLRSPLS